MLRRRSVINLGLRTPLPRLIPDPVTAWLPLARRLPQSPARAGEVVVYNPWYQLVQLHGNKPAHPDRPPQARAWKTHPPASGRNKVTTISSFPNCAPPTLTANRVNALQQNSNLCAIISSAAPYDCSPSSSPAPSLEQPLICITGLRKTKPSNCPSQS